jgi:hypothetical protein
MHIKVEDALICLLGLNKDSKLFLALSSVMATLTSHLIHYNEFIMLGIPLRTRQANPVLKCLPREDSVS